MPPHPETWLKVTEAGLYCEPGGFFIDPLRPVDRAVITHGHSDHARPGHRAVLATAETLAIMTRRLGEGRAGESQQALGYAEALDIGGVRVTLRPAGHVLGSAQVVLEWQGARAVVSGDYKTRRDPTCATFEPVPCDVFVTEATFGLPVFRHPPAEEEIARLLASLRVFPERTHVVGAYALGKTQRVLALLREAGYDAPIYVHGALTPMNEVYASFGITLGDLRPATVANREALAGAVVIGPPGAIQDRWARRLSDPVVALASGWMRVRQRAKSRGVELPLVISDHADWDELNATLDAVAAPEVWVTHGAEDALIHAAGLRGIRGRALHLVGRGDEDEAVAEAPSVAGSAPDGAREATEEPP
ncbi:ligase-associated DNA damage response exonuclease [Elioraea rosea]|uniref:ligase-associated DNA damage response exonuclease n=1 Tax=Elioraea rosea TaxID=2492390 RepID=UPI00118434F4|nr:ligase-associated DNA damage response exonuclease [Elioraea rosea]